MKVFFIGDPMLANGYRLSGVDVKQVKTPEEMLSALEDVYKIKDAGIVLVDRDYSSQIKDKIERMRVKQAIPVLVEMPGRKTGADTDLKSMVGRIMGVKV